MLAFSKVYRVLAAALLPAVGLAAQETRSPFDAATVQFPDNTSIVRMADVNGDGLRDAIGFFWYTSTQSSIGLRVFEAAGDGTFDNQLFSQSISTGSDSFWAVEAGNLDGANGADILTAFQQSSADVRIYTSTSSGSLTLQASWDEPWPVRSAALVDFDKNGLDDVVLAGDGVRLYHNTGTGYTLVDSLPSGRQVRVGELDAVPGPDLLVLDDNSLQIVPVHGLSFGTPTSFAQSLAPLSQLHPVVGDIDGDGDDDAVLFSDPGMCLVLRRMDESSFHLEAEAVGGPATDFADIDGDGDLDGLCCGGGGPTTAHNQSPSTYRISFNDGGGNFQMAQEAHGLGAYRLAGAEDVDADGDLDLVAGRTIIFNRGIGAEHELQPEAGDGRFVAAVVDVDGDGDLDLGARADWGFSYVRRENNGAGRFEVHSGAIVAPVGTFISGAAAEGDFDGDGDADVITYHWQNTSTFLGMKLFRNTGGGEFVDAGYATANGQPFLPVTYFEDKATAFVADLDSDGDLDIVAGRVFGLQAARIWWNDGTGMFTIGGLTTWMPVVTRAEDLDADGHIDLIGSAICWGQGNGGFSSSTNSVGPNFEAEVDRLDIADMDGDGSLDLVYWVSGSEFRVYLQTSPRTFVPSYIPFEVPYAIDYVDQRRIFLEDFDLDGDVDVLLLPIFDNTQMGRIFWNDGNVQFPELTDQLVGLPIAAFDVDGDGDRDLVGDRVVRSTRVLPETAGVRRQYGESAPGLGSMSPTLGASIAPGGPGSLELRLTGGRGGAAAILAVGWAPAEFADFPLTGATTYLAPVFTVPLVLGGAPSAAGAGSAVVPISIGPAFSGLSFYHQAFVIDADGSIAGLLSQTGGLELTYP